MKKCYAVECHLILKIQSHLFPKFTPQSEPEDSKSIVGTAEFSQFGENIRAKVTRNISRAGKPIKRVFNYEGKIRGGQILLTFNEPKGGHFITGNIVLKLSGNMEKLSGYTVYLQHDTNEIVARKIWFTRK